VSVLGRRSLLAGLTSTPFLGVFVGAPAVGADPDEAEARRQRSIARLKKEGVPYIDWLPRIQNSSEARRPSADAVARRFCALMLMTHRALAGDAEGTQALRKAFGNRAAFSPEERVFMDAVDPTEHAIIQASWLCEAALPMAWALGRIQTLERPDRQTEVDSLWAMISGDHGRALVSEARLRPIGEVLDEADLIYRYHWAVRQARIDGKDAPAGLDGGVVMERHKGLNWLVGDHADWDEVTTDT